MLSLMLRAFTWLTIFTASGCILGGIAGCNNGSSGSPSSTSRTPPPSASASVPSSQAAAASPRSTQGTAPRAVIFQARAAADLGTPLLQALLEAERKKLPLRVELAAGDYGAATVQLVPLESAHGIDIELVATGGNAVLHGAISIEARSVKVSGVLLDKPQLANSALSIRASRAIELDGVAVIGAGIVDRDHDALVHLTALGPGTTATITRLWIVGNRFKTGGTLLSLDNNGGGYFDRAIFTKSVFAHNRATTGLATWFTRKVSFDDFAVFEPELRDSWLEVRSPITAIALGTGTVAVGTLAAQGVGPDSKLSDFPKITTKDTHLFGPSNTEHIESSGATFAEAMPTPMNWDAVLSEARALASPKIANLVGSL